VGLDTKKTFLSGLEAEQLRKEENLAAIFCRQIFWLHTLLSLVKYTSAKIIHNLHTVSTLRTIGATYVFY